MFVVCGVPSCCGNCLLAVRKCSTNRGAHSAIFIAKSFEAVFVGCPYNESPTFGVCVRAFDLWGNSQISCPLVCSASSGLGCLNVPGTWYEGR